MSERLFSIIQNKVYKSKEIQEVSMNSRDKVFPWIFDFKSQSLSKVFLEEYAGAFWKAFPEYVSNPVQVGGMETGAIALIAGVSLFAPESARVNSFYIRKSRKKSDLANLIEGDIQNEDPIVLVDDLINRGSTIKKQIIILKERGYRVSAIFTCLRFRDMSAYQDLIDDGIKIVSIFDLNDFSEVLPVKNLVTPKAKTPVQHYIVDYKVTLTNKPSLYKVIPKSGPVLYDKTIYMGVDDGNFFCLDAESGAVVWSYKVVFGSDGKRIFSTPVVYKDVVIFGAYDGNLYCLDRLTGKRKWVFTDADWIGSSPCIDEGRGIVFVGLEFGLFKKRGGIVAVDIATGEAVWKNYALMEEYTHASPAFNKKHNIVVCGSNDHYVYAFNAKKGTLLWKYKTDGEVKYSATFDDKRNLVIVASMDGGVYAINIKDGSLYHRFGARFGFYSTATLVGDRIIIGSLDKKVYCYNIVTKETVWVYETNGRIFASPTFDGDSVFIGSNDGKLYELQVQNGEMITSIQLSERIVNRIQIGHTSNGKRVLYIPTFVGELYRAHEE